MPMQRGGTDEIQNLQAAHASCNLWKGTRLMSELPEPPDWLPG
ncbi:MAG: HNH endonuclease [Chloroflexi bacterium]|nr:HNH endonuclease [Chloroflexota bacterium]